MHYPNLSKDMPVKIPDEAVNAALDVLPYQAADYVDMDTMRAALEAALPFLKDLAK